MDWCPRITGSLQGTFPFLRNSFSLERTQDEPEYVGGRGVSFPSMQLSGYNSWLSCAPPDGFIIHLKLARLLPLFFAAVCRKGNGIWKDSKVKWVFLSFRLTPVSYGDDKATRDNVKLGVAALPILSVLYRRTMRGQCGGLIHPPGALASVPQQSPGGKKKKKGPSPLPLRVGDAQGHDGGGGIKQNIYICI